ncbi:nuclease-related domain-containing protein [Marinilactibacillus piezotolerans]|uniref:nuclease-related domain-containing protein n=1 Tax=Marinilactibacillus piezotolerans TaxID=258723 RepID=UPI00211923AC|nr:nuclease-related domain-containing protein [Marinilactibacillus piezotolerans]
MIKIYRKEIIIILVLLPVFLVLTLYALILVKYYIEFNQSNYGEASGNNYVKTFFNKGNVGEFKIFRLFEQINVTSKIMTNLYIPKSNGQTTEIDTVFICCWGIFVIESKNYSGWIYGNEKQRQWTQTFKNGQKFKFFNPIWQNSGHITALKEALRLSDDQLYRSLIVFSDHSTLKKIDYNKQTATVLYRTQLKRYVKSVIQSSPPVLQKEHVEAVAQRLSSYQRVNSSTKQRHIDQVKQKQL